MEGVKQKWDLTGVIKDTEITATPRIVAQVTPGVSMVFNGSMPTEVDGLPLHPLLVHLPVVLVPLLVLFALAYVLIPPVRQRVGWAVLVLAVIAPVAVFFARLSGEKFAASLPSAPGGLADHEQFGDWLLWASIAVLPLFLLFGALERGRRTAAGRAYTPAAKEGEEAPKPRTDDPAATGRRIVMIVLGVLLVAAAAANAYIVFKSGHTGAKMVWYTGS